MYHIIVRGNNGQPIFVEEKDNKIFLSLLKQTKQRYPFVLAAYVLMPNHVHLLVQVKKDSTSRIMQSLLTAYVRYFNITHERRGHLFQGRYKAILCEKDVYLMELIRYIHLNPVRAHLSSTPAQWPWSGHGEYSGERSGLIDHNVICDVFGNGAKGFERYTAFLSDGIGQGYVEDFHPGERNPFLGSGKFQDSLINKPVPAARRGKRECLDDILRLIASKRGLNPEVIRQKLKVQPVAKARAAFIKEAVVEHGYHRAEVSRYLNCGESYISKVVRSVI
jgi:REP element-mobilizing transposase RayT